MATRLFTFGCEFRGSTYVSQVTATDEADAVLAWTKTLKAERPFGRASKYLAASVVADAGEFLPVAISGIDNVWCISGKCGGDLMLADIVETVSASSG